MLICLFLVIETMPSLVLNLWILVSVNYINLYLTLLCCEDNECVLLIVISNSELSTDAVITFRPRLILIEKFLYKWLLNVLKIEFYWSLILVFEGQLYHLLDGAVELGQITDMFVPGHHLRTVKSLLQCRKGLSLG